ncbi:MAG TPA: PQQ-binding-like beta-propeller repeat protein, partial [Acidobacteriota bacterium]|nr:PQQ-binding-like beta-propeller repeat protein [Acidobacteriota bacterium]
MKRFFPAVVICMTVVLYGSSLSQSASAKGTNWPQWRGPDGTGVSTETDLPLEWGRDRSILWKTAIPGRGHSSPVVWGSRIFLTTDLEGEVIPGARAVTHVIEGK